MAALCCKASEEHGVSTGGFWPLLGHLPPCLGYFTCGLIFQLGKVNIHWVFFGGCVCLQQALGQEANFNSCPLELQCRPEP